ncbi:MAG: tetratricopeptide repeat protein [Phycisphaeraceae bacterium]|nr:tetratricopeptide repeat protein [Phycisphaeraceae bacterium]
MSSWLLVQVCRAFTRAVGIERLTPARVPVSSPTHGPSIHPLTLAMTSGTGDAPRPTATPAARTEVSNPSSPRPARIRGWRLGLLRLLLIVAAPALLLLALEGGLRVFGYGYPTGLFLTSNGLCRTNPYFGWQFFPVSVATVPAATVTPLAKPPNTCRIVVVGGSAAFGTPVPAFGFGRMLEVMLRERHPGVEFEVINAALPSISSHGVLRAVRDAAPLRPDIYLVYMGNNEVVGCYGVGTAFMERSPQRWVIRAAIEARSLRLGQLLLSLAPGHGFGMLDKIQLFRDRPIRHDDPRLQIAYSHLRRNLTDMCDAAQDAGANVVLCTVAVNFRDWSPFASAHTPGLAQQDLDRWNALYQQALAAQQDRQWAQAADLFQQAAAIDDRHADLHFRWGRCLLELGDGAGAGSHLRLARDLDTLRFRADGPINEVIRQMAMARADRGVRLVDVDQAYADVSPNGIPGDNLFYDHVHMSIAGNYRLALTVLHDVENALPAWAVKGWDPASAPTVSNQTVENALALTPWDRADLEAAMHNMSGFLRTLADKSPSPDQPPPLADQTSLSRPKLQTITKATPTFGRRDLTPPEVAATLNAYRQAIQRRPDDLYFRERFSRFLQEKDDWAPADEQIRFLTERIPEFWELYLRRARVLYRLDDLDGSILACQRSLSLNPYQERAWVEMGMMYRDISKRDLAMRAVEHARDLNPGSPANYFLLAQMTSRFLNDDRGALALSEQALRLAPREPAVLTQCAQLRVASHDPAVRDMPKALELATAACEHSRYADAEALEVLAAASSQLGRFPQAIDAAEKALAVARQDRPDLLPQIQESLKAYRAHTVPHIDY